MGEYEIEVEPTVIKSDRILERAMVTHEVSS